MSTLSPVHFERRIYIILGVFAALFLLLGARLFVLQILRGDHYEDVVRSSRLEIRPVPARRGDIVDRFGLSLARTVDSHTLAVHPAVFRENNLLDAWTDLAVAQGFCLALSPEMKDDGLRTQVSERIRLYQSAFDHRQEIVKCVLQAETHVWLRRGPHAPELIDRLIPRGSLILEPSGLGSRIHSALLLVADRNVVDDQAVLRRRLRENQSTAAALGILQNQALKALEEERRELEALAAEALGAPIEQLLELIFGGEIREWRSIEEKIVEIIDDRIAVDRLGTHEFSELSAESRAELVRSVAKPLNDRRLILEEWSRFEDAAPDSSEASLRRAAQIEQLAAICAGRRPHELEDFELASVASLLGLFADDDRSLKRGLGEQVRAALDFQRDTFLSPAKEWARRLQFKGWYSAEIARGCTFDLGNRVWATFGLRRLGFVVEPSQSRDYWGDEDGVLTLIMGRLTRNGTALSGLEASLEDPAVTGARTIVGTDGSVSSLRDPSGGPEEILDVVPPVHGPTMMLTLDRDLIWHTEKILHEMVKVMTSPDDPSAGAGACVIDIETGDVLVLATSPGLPGREYLSAFEAAAENRRERDSLVTLLKSGRITRTDFDRDMARVRAAEEKKPFVERALTCCDTGYYPPGSTMKTFVGLLGLERGLITGHETLVCNDKKFHGSVDLGRALMVSCNDYFWTLGSRLGAEDVRSFYASLGLFGAVPGLMPESSGRLRLRQTQGDSARNLAIGEGSMQTSPFEVAAMYAVLARGGVRIVPRFLKAVNSMEVPARQLEPLQFQPQNIEKVLTGLRMCTDRIAERERRLADFSHRKIAGKTGTAEGYVGRHKEENLAWFAGVAPYDRPRFAFAVFCEHTHHQGRHVPVFAARILDACFKKFVP